MQLLQQLSVARKLRLNMLGLLVCLIVAGARVQGMGEISLATRQNAALGEESTPASSLRGQALRLEQSAGVFNLTAS